MTHNTVNTKVIYMNTQKKTTVEDVALHDIM